MEANEARRILATGYTTKEFRGLNFDGMALSSISLGVQVRLTQCSFVNADLRQATFDQASFHRCDFTGANLQGASMRGAFFAECDLRGANLRDVDLTGARLSYINTGKDGTGRTDVTGADLTNAVLVDVVVERVIGWPVEQS